MNIILRFIYFRSLFEKPTHLDVIGLWSFEYVMHPENTGSEIIRSKLEHVFERAKSQLEASIEQEYT